MLKMCPICKSYHNPDVACIDKAGSYLKEIGINRKKMSTEEEKKLTKKINRIFFILALLFLVFFIFIIYINR